LTPKKISVTSKTVKDAIVGSGVGNPETTVGVVIGMAEGVAVGATVGVAVSGKGREVGTFDIKRL
jgi:hypothetical protein